MADIRYVNESYVDDSYVVITFDSGSVSINNTTSVSASAGNVKSAESTIQTSIANNRSWDEMGTWYEPIQEVWDQFIIVEPLLSSFAPVSPIITSTAVTSTATKQLVSGAVTISADATFTVTAEANREGETITAFSTTVVSDADVIREGTSTITTTTTTLADAITGYSETVSLNITTTVTADEQLISLPGSDITVATTTTAQAGRVNPATADIIETITTTASTGETGSFADAVITVNTSVADTDSVNIFGGVSNVQTATVLSGLGDKVILPTVNISAFTITVSTAAGFAVEPYRTFQIDSESRINILQQETRSRLVPSETRIFKVTPGSNTKVVDLAGIIDRREG